MAALVDVEMKRI